MTATTNVTIARQTWTQVGGASPSAILVKSNMNPLHHKWRLIVAGSLPAATDIGNRLNAGDSWSGNTVVGNVYCYAEEADHELAITV